MTEHDPDRDVSVDAPTARYARSIIADWTAGDGLSPKDIVQAWVNGLKAAGATDARTSKMHTVALPRVVEFDCPFWHDGLVVGTFAKVRVLVREDGWVSHFEGLVLDPDDGPKFNTASCKGCAEREPLRFAEWLLSCPRCAADEPVATHPEHDRFYDPLAPDEPWRPSLDESPFAKVLDACIAPTAFKKQPAKEKPQPKTKQWTEQSAADWLDGLGDAGASKNLSQTEVWKVVKDIDGHPPQSVVRRAQALRKTRGTRR